jgi:hypothetical protein
LLAVLVGLAATAWGQDSNTLKPAAGPTALQRGAACLQQALAIVFNEPAAGRCHVLDLEAVGGAKGKSPTKIQLRFVHGAQGKFAFKCKLPMIGEAWIGQGSAPWMVAGGKTVLLGAKSPTSNHSPLRFADPQHFSKLQMVKVLVATIVQAPDMLKNFLTVEDAKNAQGGHDLRFSTKKASEGEILVSFQDDGRTPSGAVVNLPTLQKAGIEGKITIHGWHVNELAKEAWFAPPADLPTREVEQADLYRVFSAIFDLAMERTE